MDEYNMLAIASLNTKGGVGKTTVCHHLTAPLIARGNRVLLIDMDYQGNLSRGFLGPQFVDELPYQKTTAALFDDHLEPAPEELLIEAPTVEGLWIVPAAKMLKDFAFPKPETLGEYQFILREFLEEVAGQFDVVLIDCHPSLDLLAWNALTACEFVLCPFQPEDYGAQGISLIQEAIDQVVETTNSRLRLLGYLLNQARKCALHRTFESVLRDYYGRDVFETVVPQAIQLPEAVAHRMPVGLYKKRVKVAKLFDDLATEMLGRVERVRKQPARYLYLGNNNRGLQKAG